MIKSDNTIQIIEQNIYQYFKPFEISLCGCNNVANNILNDFKTNGFEIVKIAMGEK